MKRLLAMLLGAALSFSARAQVSVTATQGTAGPTTYTTLGAAFTAINSGTHKGVISITIVANTTEASTASLSASAAVAGSNPYYTSVSIRPSGARSVTGSLAAALVELNGADNVTIDGLNDGTNSLTISNTSTSTIANTSTIRLGSGATNNTVRNCTLLGSFSDDADGNQGGTVLISTASSGGNSNNTISDNKIGPAGSNLPSKAINGNGSSGAMNANNTISNNLIYDYFQAGKNSAGIYLNASNTGWTISGNKFYQTATRGNTSGVQHSAMWMVPTNGAGFVVSNNIIGYSSASGTGLYTMGGTTSSCKFVPFYFQAGDGTNTISGNIITALSASAGYSGTGSSSPLRMLFITSSTSNADIVLDDNTIGSSTAAGAIVLTTSSSSTMDVFGMYLNGVKTATLTNNKVGGMTLNLPGNSATKIIAINLNNSGGTSTVQGNTIGGSVSNSFNNTSNSSSSQMIGVQTNGAGTFSSNTISNLSGNGGAGSSSIITGMYFTGTAALTISQNTIYNIAHLGTSGSGSIVSGMQVDGGSIIDISRNKIYNISSAAVGTSTVSVNGIYANGGTTTNIFNNVIGDIKALAANVTDAVRGITLNASTASTAANVYFNSIYISGTSSGSTFGSAAIYHRSSTTATTNALNLRNNILVNMAVAKGTGVTAALRRSNAAQEANYNTASNNNLFYAGTPSATNLLYYDGTNGDQTLAAFKTRFTNREAASISGSPNFTSTVASSSNFLRVNTSEPTSIESGGVAINGYTTDYDGDTRSTTPDMGADEFAGTACAVSITNSGALCAVNGPTLNSSSPSTFNQWNLNGTAINGATNTTYVASVGGSYTVSLIAPTCSVTSAAKVVFAESVAPAILNSSVSSTVCAGSNVILTQTGGSLGDGASWHWYTDAAFTQPVGGSLNSANAQLTVTPSVTTTYYLRAENGSAPCAATVSGNATVTITVYTPSAGGTLSSAQSVCSGGSVADLSLSGSNGSIVWQSASDAAFTQNLTTYGSTTATLSGAEIGALTQSIYVRAVVTNGTGCVPSNSNSVLLTANPYPVAYAVTGGGTYCDGVGRAVGIAGSENGVSYQLVKDGVNEGSPVAGTGGALSFGVHTAGAYTVMASNSNNCSISMTGSAVLDAVGPFTAQISAAENIFCAAGASTMINVSNGPANGTVIVTTNGANPVAQQLDANGAASFSSGMLNANTTFAITSVGNATCMRTVNITTVVYVGRLFATPLPNQSVCPGNTVGPLAFMGNFPAGTTYNWTSTNPEIGLAQTSGTGLSLPSFTATNSSNETITSEIAVWPNINMPGCAVSKMVFRISVKPMPVVDPVGNQSVCSGTQIAAISFAGNVAGTTYNWSNSNTAIGLGAIGADEVSSFTATNNSSQGSISGTITVVPTKSGCTGAPVSFTITVNRASAQITYPNSPYCPVGPANPVLTGTNGGVYSAPSGIVFNNSSTGEINLANSVPGTYTVTYTIAGPVGGCGGTSTTPITILPRATVNGISNQAICAGSQTAMVVPAGTASGFSWSVLNTTVGLAASGNGAIPAFTAMNNGTGTVTAQVNVQPLGDGTSTCNGNIVAYHYTIYPRPTVNTVTVPGYCRGVLTTPVTFSSATSGTTFAWRNNNPTIGLPAHGTSGLPSFAAQNPNGAGSSISNNATITVTPTANKCVGAPYQLTLSVLDCMTQGGGQTTDGSTARLASQLVVGPNPSIGALTIEYKGSEAGPYTVQLLNAYGQPTGRSARFSGTTYTLDLGGLTPGNYVLRFVNTRTQRVEQKQIVKL
ncbi:MAG: hypothetical protein EOP50_00570 [Sphingobacteriales bacterium]|nr:MAG: hypothetical protein EOP50_00570 [Sphingobacteriales bacterium]